MALFPILFLPSLGSGEWLRSPLIDDAYYFLAIARNMASGAGVSSDGLSTSGFQPLYLLVCVLAGSLARWDLIWTPVVVTALNWVLYNVVCLYLLTKLWKRLKAPHDGTTWIVALLWLCHPYGQRASLNGMETTLVLVLWILLGLTLVGWWDRPMTLRAALAVGAVLGIAFLARNDAVVLSISVGIIYCVRAMKSGDLAAAPARFRRRLRSLALVAGATAVWASPWLAYCYSVTGALMPQSGHAEFAGGIYDRGRSTQAAAVIMGLASNLSVVPLGLARLAARSTTLGVLVGVVAVGILLFLAGLAWKKGTSSFRRTIELYGLSAGMLVLVYATFFGAPHMAIRWLLPVLILGVLVIAQTLAMAWRSGRVGRGCVIAVLGVVILGRVMTALQDSRVPNPTNTYPMLEYLRRTGEVGRVGSFQSGLLAWTHSGVVNLDGKVSGPALKAYESGRFASWLADGDLSLVMDWDLFGFDRDPEVLRAFDRHTEPGGLIVLSRKHR